MNTKNMGILMVRGSNNSGTDCKDTNGETYNAWGSQFFDNLRLRCGNNTTAPTVLDYQFTEVEGLTMTSNTKVMATPGSYSDSIAAYMVMTTVYWNNTANSISVSEVALTVYRDSHMVLFAREVLETPVVIPAGESYAFSMTII